MQLNLNWNELSARLAAAAQDKTGERPPRVIAVLCQAFRELGPSTPIIVGGAAVEYYTDGGIASKDIDALLSYEPARQALVMEPLGFIRKGASWFHPERDLWIEFPGRLGDTEMFEANTILVDGVEVRIAALEFLILDRVLASVSGTSHTERDRLSAIALIMSAQEPLNWGYMRYWAEHEGALDALEAIRSVAESTDVDAIDKDEVYRRIRAL